MRIHALPIGCIVLTSLAWSCHKELTFEAINNAPDAIAVQSPAGTSSWIVRPDGSVNATLKTPDGQPVTQLVTGQVTFTPANRPPTSVPVQYDPKTAVLTAAGPSLDADITPVSYSLTVGGTPWTGSIDVPKGGTEDLVATTKLQPPAAPNFTVRGPNGGIVQTVGNDRIEVVANKNTGDARAYVLDTDNHPVDPGDRKITVGVEGEQPEVVVLEPEPHGHFVVGHLRARVDPPQLTVAVNAHGATHACLVGWAPGSVVVVGPAAPRVRLLAVEAWPGEVVDVHMHARHHEEVMVGAPGVVIGGPSVVVETPGVVVGGPSVVVEESVEAHGHVGGGHEHDHDHGH